MPLRPRRRRRFAFVIAAAVLTTTTAVVVAVDTPGSRPVRVTTLRAAPTEPADPAAARAEITGAFTTLFAPAPGADPASMLEDAANLRDALAQVKTQAQAQGFLIIGTPTIDDIEFTAPTSARVDFSFELTLGTDHGSGPSPYHVRNAEALLVDGRWKVSRSTLCSLVSVLEPLCPPRRGDVRVVDGPIDPSRVADPDLGKAATLTPDTLPTTPNDQDLDPTVRDGTGGQWIDQLDADHAIVHLDRDGHELARVPIGGVPEYLGQTAGAIWVVSCDPMRWCQLDGTSTTLLRIDPTTARVVARLPLGTSTELGTVMQTASFLQGVHQGGGPMPLVSRGASLWVPVENLVFRIDTSTNTIVDRIEAAAPHWSVSLTVAGDFVWIGGAGDTPRTSFAVHDARSGALVHEIASPVSGGWVSAIPGDGKRAWVIGTTGPTEPDSGSVGQGVDLSVRAVAQLVDAWNGRVLRTNVVPYPSASTVSTFGDACWILIAGRSYRVEAPAS